MNGVSLLTELLFVSGSCILESARVRSYLDIPDMAAPSSIEKCNQADRAQKLKLSKATVEAVSKACHLKHLQGNYSTPCVTLSKHVSRSFLSAAILRASHRWASGRSASMAHRT